MDALVLDFDGVVVDSEPIHLACFQRVLAESMGVRLTREEYFRRYLGYDDRDCLATVVRDQGARLTNEQLLEMVAQKTVWVKEAFAGSLEPLPGSAALIRAASDAGTLMAVCSGALREEIELALRTIGVSRHFLH